MRSTVLRGLACVVALVPASKANIQQSVSSVAFFLSPLVQDLQNLIKTDGDKNELFKVR